MKKVIHRADTRGHSQYDWLDSYHTFSFDEYFDSNRINFGALRVLNDDKSGTRRRIPDASAQEYGNCIHSPERTSATWRQQEKQPDYYRRRNPDYECRNRNFP